MAVRTFDELMASIKTRTEGMTDDETLAFIEDISDTLRDAEEKTKDNTKWKDEYERNDKEGREKYKERFFGDTPDNYEEDEESSPVDDVEKKTFDDLFKVEED